MCVENREKDTDRLYHGYSVMLPDMQKVATTQPLVADIFSECGRIKAEILLNLWKLSAGIL